MTTLFEFYFGGPNVAIAVVVGVCAAWAITSVAKQWRKVRVAELEANLKRQMLEKEMPLEEMERVLRASKDDGSPDSYSFTGQEDADKAVLVKMLSDYAYSGADIERVLHACAVPVQAADPSAAWLARAKAAQAMIENENSAEEIEQMLRAFHVRENSVAHEGIQVTRS